MLKKVIYTLGEMGPSADPAAHALVKLDGSLRMKMFAKRWLTRWPRWGRARPRPSLRSSRDCTTRSRAVRLAAAYAIGELGPNHPRALQALAQLDQRPG